MQNLKSKINKQNKNKLIKKENVLMAATWKGVRREVKNGKGL